MRHAIALLIALTLAACAPAPAPRDGAPIAAAAPAEPAPAPVVEFLIQAAATDFRAHRPPDPVRFRDVRLGHVMTARGEPQYMLCGEFLAAGTDGKDAWTRFATIKTSDYEQWLGAQAAGFCDGPAVTWDRAGDLSATLLRALQALR